MMKSNFTSKAGGIALFGIILPALAACGGSSSDNPQTPPQGGSRNPPSTNVPGASQGGDYSTMDDAPLDLQMRLMQLRGKGESLYNTRDVDHYINGVLVTKFEKLPNSDHVVFDISDYPMHEVLTHIDSYKEKLPGGKLYRDYWIKTNFGSIWVSTNPVIGTTDTPDVYANFQRFATTKAELEKEIAKNPRIEYEGRAYGYDSNGEFAKRGAVKIVWEKEGGGESLSGEMTGFDFLGNPGSGWQRWSGISKVVLEKTPIDPNKLITYGSARGKDLVVHGSVFNAPASIVLNNGEVIKDKVNWQAEISNKDAREVYGKLGPTEFPKGLPESEKKYQAILVYEATRK